MSKPPKPPPIPATPRSWPRLPIRLAAMDQDFLLGDSTRGLRFHMEYTKAEERRAPGRALDRSWCSARRASGRMARRAPALVCPRPRFAKLASEQAAPCSTRPPVRDNVVCTGGGPGIMEAANRGAADAGAPSIGLNIRLPMEQEPNAWSTPELTFPLPLLAMRKMHFARRANGLVVFPAASNADELFEILTPAPDRKSPSFHRYWLNRAYWTEVIDFEASCATAWRGRRPRPLLVRRDGGRNLGCAGGGWRDVAGAADAEDRVTYRPPSWARDIGAQHGVHARW